MKGPSYMIGQGFAGFQGSFIQPQASLNHLDLNSQMAVQKGLVTFTKPNLVPKTPMLPTAPPQHIQPILFQTQKIWDQWPLYMFKTIEEVEK